MKLAGSSAQLRHHQLRRGLEPGFRPPRSSGREAVQLIARNCRSQPTEKSPLVASILIVPKCAMSLPSIPSQFIRLEATGL
jgi:hypothetical protein